MLLYKFTGLFHVLFFFFFSFEFYNDPVEQGKEGTASSILEIKKSRPRGEGHLTGILMTRQGLEQM